MLSHHHFAATDQRESPRDDHPDTSVPFQNLSSYFLAPPSMIKPSNLADLEIVASGKAVDTRLDRKYEIQLTSCNNSTGHNPIFNLTNLKSARHNSTSGELARIAYAGFHIVGQEKRATTEPLGADNIQVIIGLPNGARREIAPSEIFTVAPGSEFQYTWMDLSSV